MRLITYRQLEAKGVAYTRRWIEMMIKEKRFPAPVRLGPHRLAFVEAEVDAWIAERAALRDAPKAA